MPKAKLTRSRVRSAIGVFCWVVTLCSQTATAQVNPAPDRTDELITLIRVGNLPGIKKLIETGIEINARGKRGDTPLVVAVQTGSTAAVRLLLSHGARPNMTDGYRDSPLYYASEDSLPTIMKLLLAAGADPDELSNRDFPLILQAATENHLESVRLLLKAGAFVDAPSSEGKTALMLSFENPLIIKALLGAGAFLEAKDNDGRTALFYAVMLIQPGKLDMLVKAGADINVVDKEGTTPLGYVHPRALTEKADGVRRDYSVIYDQLIAFGAIESGAVRKQRWVP